MKKIRTSLAAAAALLALATALSACGALGTASSDLGKKGGPVTLTVGYQPYYAEAWSGAILRSKQLWKKYLPPGSKVNFQVGLQGSVITSQMLAGKEQIGYMGDMPAIVGASKRSTRDLRIVSTLGIAQDQCAVFLVRKNAPSFANQQAAIRWMDGKTVSTPQGSCTDRIAQATFRKFGVKPKEYLNQSLDVIASNFQSGKIDAAIVWEPTASRLVNAGIAKRVASGSLLDERDAGLMLMSKDLIDSRPDIARDWLRAELAAQRYLVDPSNARDVAQTLKAQTQGFTVRDLWDALYRTWPVPQGGPADGVRIRLPFVVNAAVRDHIDKAVTFLAQIKAIGSAKLPPGAVDDSLAQQVLRNAAAPGQITARKDEPR